jgi:hypothetical protein
VAPFLTVVPELERDREHRVRGVLAAVNTANGNVTLTVRPFRHQQGDFGRLVFATDGEPRYEINGTEYAGSAGLAAREPLAATPVVAQGPVNDRLLTADIVLAGDSVPERARRTGGDGARGRRARGAGLGVTCAVKPDCTAECS